MLTPAETIVSQRLCYLETTGRMTGKPHEVEMWFAADPDAPGTLYLLSGGGERRDWVKNIRRSSAVSVRIGDARYLGSARIVPPAGSADRRAREIVAAKYQGWSAGQPFSQWARESLAVAIELEGLAT